MFNLFALLRHDPLKPATPLTNDAIDETLQQFAPLSDDCLFQLVDCRELSIIIIIRIVHEVHNKKASKHYNTMQRKYKKKKEKNTALTIQNGLRTIRTYIWKAHMEHMEQRQYFS